MSENKNHVSHLAAVKLPTASIDFLRRNPKIQGVAGKLMCALIEAKSLVAGIENVFTVENFKGGLENGTEEELRQFVYDALLGSANAQKFNNLPPGAFEKLKEELGERLLMTPVVLNEPSKEAVA